MSDLPLPEALIERCGSALEDSQRVMNGDAERHPGEFLDAGWKRDEYGFEGMKHGLAGPENSGDPVYRIRDESGHRAVWSAEEVTAIHDALFDLCEAVSDFHTSITCMDSELVVPDMLAAMDHSQRRARAALARVHGPEPEYARTPEQHEQWLDLVHGPETCPTCRSTDRIEDPRPCVSARCTARNRRHRHVRRDLSDEIWVENLCPDPWHRGPEEG